MRQIRGSLTDELNKQTDSKSVGKDLAYPIKTYRELVEHTAKLSYENKDYLLFYRGQKNDYRNKANTSSFYPTIYRGDYVTQEELNFKFDLLDAACKLLIQSFKDNKIQGRNELERKRFIQWSILQHYEVTDTPLIDITHSLRVACSFAQLDNPNKTAFIYLFGLPYITNRITVNSEHDLVNIRLLSITPPSALRPYFQEGYLVGTEDITNEYVSKSELDLNQRLIAKFEIPNNEHFWGNQFNRIPKDALYPDKDKIKNICDEIKPDLKPELQDSELGSFLKLWSELEALIMQWSSQYARGIMNPRRAIQVLSEKEPNLYGLLKEIDFLRRFRNNLVHKPTTVTKEETQRSTNNLRQILSELKNAHNRR